MFRVCLRASNSSADVHFLLMAGKSVESAEPRGNLGPILGPEPGPEPRIRRVMTTEQRAAVVAFSQAVTHFLHIIPWAEVNLSFQPYPGGEFQRVASAGGGKGGTGEWPAKVWNRGGTGVESDASAKMFASSKRKTAPGASGTGRDPKRPNPNYPVEEEDPMNRTPTEGAPPGVQPRIPPSRGRGPDSFQP